MERYSKHHEFRLPSEVEWEYAAGRGLPPPIILVMSRVNSIITDGFGGTVESGFIRLD